MMAHRHDERALEETLEWLRPLVRRLGISRVSEVTWIDYVGMPVFQAVRPRSRNLVVSQGKGLTRAHAEISAIMESVEMFHAEDIPTHARASFAEMEGRLSYDVGALNLVRPALDRHLVVDWVQAENLCSGAVEYVPSELLSMDFMLRERVYTCPFRRTSNGLGSGRSRAQALLHGLYEVIERDCLSGAEPVDVTLADPPPATSALVSTLAKCGIRVEAEAYPNRFDLPCFRAFIIEQDTSVQFWGAGCDSLVEKALLKALTEAVQSRLTLICGGRDDINEAIYLKFPTASADERRREAGAVTLEDIREHVFGSIDEELAWLIETLSTNASAQPLAVDLTRDDLEIPVYFTVVPGLSFTVRGH